MPCLRGLLLSGLCLTLAPSAAANVTVDLFWVDSLSSTLTLTVGDPGAGNACNGFHFAGTGRCMQIRWTVGAEGLAIGGNSLSWNPGSGLSALHAAFFPAFRAIPVGKSSSFGPFPSAHFPTTNIDNASGVVAGFIGAIPASDPMATNHLPAGSYVVGTLIFDTSSLAPGVHSIVAFLTPGLDDFFDSSSTSSPVQLNGATLQVVPEAGTALLLGAALCGLVLARRSLR